MSSRPRIVGKEAGGTGHLRGSGVGMTEAIHDHNIVTRNKRMASAISVDLATAVDVRSELEAKIAGVFGRRESRAYAVG